MSNDAMVNHITPGWTPARRRLTSVAAFVAILLLWPWVYIITCTAYTYLYWVFPTLKANVYADTVDSSELPVPAIIHQTWKSREIPEKWREAQKSCIDLHPEYEYRLWTDDDGLELIKTQYPWFLSTYNSYPYNIQRVDAVRYFILHHFGGIYLDLDVGCLKRLDFLRQANFTAPLTYPVGISNDIMAAQKNSIFMERAIRQLQRWNHWMFIKYIQVMFGTGPMFLTVQYALSSRRIARDVSVIEPPTYGKYDNSGDPAFYHLHGSSWHAEDAVFIFWLDKYKYHLVAGSILIVMTLIGIQLRQRHQQRMKETVENSIDLEKNT